MECHQINTRDRNTRDKMAVGNSHTSIIAVNASGLNLPVEKHGVVDWIKKQNPTIFCLQETYLSGKYMIQSTKIYRPTTKRTKGRNRPKHNHSWGP